VESPVVVSPGELCGKTDGPDHQGNNEKKKKMGIARIPKTKAGGLAVSEFFTYQKKTNQEGANGQGGGEPWKTSRLSLYRMKVCLFLGGQGNGAAEA